MQPYLVFTINIFALLFLTVIVPKDLKYGY